MSGACTETRTIKADLNRYFRTTAFFSLLLLLFCVIMLACNQIWQGYENKRLYQLNDFYSGLRDMNTTYIKYTRYGGDGRYENLLRSGTELEHILYEISEIPAGEAFHREVRDISRLFEQYMENLRAIKALREKKSASYAGEKEDMYEVQSNINSFQKVSLSIYTQINEAFQSQYSKILQWLQKNSGVRLRIMGIAIIQLILTVAACVIYQSMKASDLSSRISVPLAKLAEQMKKFQNSGLYAKEQVIPLPVLNIGNVETATLTDGFNEMMAELKRNVNERESYLNAENRLREKIIENLKIQKELKENQVRIIQARINPHFLFNTLNLVSQSAYLEDAPVTVKLLGKTASLLRYYLDFSDKKVLLGREWDELQNYVDLQKERFGSKIQFEMRIEEKAKKYYVPSQILQPIVENSIIHGVSGYSSGGMIQITGDLSQDESWIMLSIADNGKGMSEDQKNHLYEAFSNGAGTGKHVGLGSISTKLKYYYGEKSDITISSDPGVETVFCLKIPALLE